LTFDTHDFTSLEIHMAVSNCGLTHQAMGRYCPRTNDKSGSQAMTGTISRLSVFRRLSRIRAQRLAYEVGRPERILPLLRVTDNFFGGRPSGNVDIHTNGSSTPGGRFSPDEPMMG
jgi:hypothetical protein